MSYKIIITETRQVKKLVGKEWGIVGTKEIPRDSDYWSKDDTQPKTRIEEVRGYTPEIEKTVSETVETLSQTVETLNLPAVIKAINRL